MKRVLAMLVVGLFLATGNVFAHCGKCGVGDAPKEDLQAMVDEKTDKVAKDLKLNDEQKVQFKAILLEKKTKMQGLMEEKRKSMDAVQEEFKTKLSGILTPEQMKTWEANKEKHGDMKEHCPMCKEGKMCDKCKAKKEHCPMCKDGKKCDMCKGKKKSSKK